MTTILQINASLFSDDGQSSRLANAFVARYRATHPDTRLIVRDLARDPVPHLDADRFLAFRTPAAERSDVQRAHAAYSDALIDELRAADLIVLGLPMYNFGVPSQLKSYFDHVARAGETFRYTASGPQGLLDGKTAYVFAARGGHYLGKPQDTQTGWITDLLGFLGITDVRFVHAEGLAVNDDEKARALEDARVAIERLAA